MNNATAMRKERQKKKKNRKGHSGRKDRVQSAAERQVADDFIFSRAAAAPPRLFRWQKAAVIIVEMRQERYCERLSLWAR